MRKKRVVTHIPLTKVIIRVLSVHVILITVVSSVNPAIFIFKITRTSRSMCEPATTMSYNTTLKSNSTTKKHLTIQQTTLEQQTTVEQTNTQKQSTAMKKTTSVNQYTSAKKRTTIAHSTTVKLSTSKEQRTAVTWLPSSTSSANTMTINDTTQNTKDNKLCVCVCT